MTITIEPSCEQGRPVSIGPSLARSIRFKALFAEGMALVEEAAAYLDGAGRGDAEMLRTGLKGAYSAESMRLTTRLMQIASWLLIQRAVAGGHVPEAPVHQDRIRISLTAQSAVTTPVVLAQLPETLQTLIDRSLHLQKRILHLDRMVNTAEGPGEGTGQASGLDLQIALLRSAFATPG